MPSPECSACLTEARGHRAHIGKDIACADCIIQVFELAINQEPEYPAHWGAKKLTIDVCWKMLPPEIIMRYKAAGREYDTPAADRVYCKRTDPPRRPNPCHTFIGRWTNEKRCVRCEKCMWYTCLRCEETYSTSAASGDIATIEHDCNPKREDDVRCRALRGLCRGRDYQICPRATCGRVWALHDGCNHIVCASCKTHLCFVCGKMVKDGTGHWRTNGGCPRWNFPGDANAHFDDTDEWDDNEEVNSEVERLEAAVLHIQQQPEAPIDDTIRQAIGPALAEGRVFLLINDVEVQALLHGLTMQLDMEHGANIVFRDSDGNVVHPLRDLDEARMPQLIIRPARPRRPYRQRVYMVPNVVNSLMLRLLGLRRREPEERVMWRE